MGIWEFGNIGIWEFGIMGIWGYEKSRVLEIREFWRFKKQEIYKGKIDN